jgi:hypothetical protein
MKTLNLVDHFNDEYEADIRNRKYKMSDGLYSKNSLKLSEIHRIYYICEKKERLRAEQKEMELDLSKINANTVKMNKNGFAFDIEFGKKNRHKGKKPKKLISNAPD